MLIPNPILLASTPADGLTLAVTGERGGLAGYILLGLSGPTASVEISPDGGAAWTAVTYPRTLIAGEMLRLTRTDVSAALTTLRGLAPIDEGPAPGSGTSGAFAVTTDEQGYQTLADADVTTDEEGYQTIIDATATADPDGYESVERSTP